MATKKKTPKILRAKQPPRAIYDFELGTYIVPDPAKKYTENDRIVKAHPQAFEADEDAEPDTVTTSVPVEQATKAPGEKRPTSKS